MKLMNNRHSEATARGYREDGNDTTAYVDPGLRALYVSVILRACKDIMIPDDLKKSDRTVARDEAHDWFRLAGPDFRFICGAAGVDPDALHAAYMNGSIARAMAQRGDIDI